MGYSGGCDSHVLLHALAAIQSNLSISVRAVYVNHGISPNASAWAYHCQCVCDALSVPLTIAEVDASPRAGKSREETARHARYSAVAQLLGQNDFFCTAHHQDDQAETLLLQLLRGAGAKGLSAMPVSSVLGAGRQLRPLLDFSRDQLRQYAEHNNLHWIEDESNQDTSLDRNFLRHELMPVLTKRWPSAAKTLSRSARHNAAATQLLEEMADDDLQLCAGDNQDSLCVPRLLELGEARLKNLLRYWILINKLPLPSDKKIEHVATDVLLAAQDKTPCVKWPGAEVRRFKDHCYVMPPVYQYVEGFSIVWQDLEQALVLPDTRRLQMTISQQARAQFAGKNIEVKFRQGGESFYSKKHKCHKTLKQYFQENNIPSWQRALVPLLYVDGVLVEVVGIAEEGMVTIT